MGLLKANSSLIKTNEVSVKKTNLGRGKLSLSKFDPKKISNIALWTKQGSLTDTQDYVAISLTFTAGYSAGDIDTIFYTLDPADPYYAGDEFGFYIYYDESVGLWYLNTPGDNDTAYAENLFGPWTTYGDLDGFDLIDYDNDSYTSYNPVQYTWSDVSGKNNHLITRKNPASGGIVGGIIKELENKILRVPFKTTNTINAFLPFTIYIALLDNYTGLNTRKILGITNGGSSILYLESTSNGVYHTFTLKGYSSSFIIYTICSFNVFKTIFYTPIYGSSILKISSSYGSYSPTGPNRTINMSYYNNNPNFAFRSLSAAGVGNFGQFSSAGNLFLGNNNFGIGNLVFGNFYLSEVLVYNKSLSTEEDRSINGYLQRRYYDKLL